jgi:hypothetical protein
VIVRPLVLLVSDGNLDTRIFIVVLDPVILGSAAEV